MSAKQRARRFDRVRRACQTLAAVTLLIGIGVSLAVTANRVSDRPGGFLLALGAVVVTLLVIAAGAAVLARRVSRRTVLVLDLTQPLPDPGARDPMARLLARGRPTLRSVCETLERAGADRRVAALFARVGTATAGLADVQELRDAVIAFRASGKPAVAHAETFGEFAAATSAYYLATAFDEVHLQPSGDVGLTGLAAQVNFLREGLDKLGIVAQLDHRQEYKNAPNRLTETGFTPAHREATARLVESMFSQVVAGVAERRGLERSTVRRLIDQAPLAAADALAQGLVDRLGYRDEAVEAVTDRSGDGAVLLSLGAYARRSGRRRRRGATTVALIHGTGGVVQGKSRPHPLTVTSMGADTITAAFRQAVDDRRVKAVLFRVDSPGGSYVASDAIWRETVRARRAGKPVVVSMGNVAGSGGYFVAMAADRIVAHPGTITGSIGVVAGKAVAADLKAKLGVHTDEVHRGANALLASSSYEYTPGQWSVLQRWLDRVYADFTDKVAQGRGLPAERVAELAKGRVWTGEDAHKHGLVDALGGYPHALRLAREVAGVDADAPVRLKSFPEPPSWRDRLRRGDDEADEPWPAVPDQAAGAAHALAELARHAGVGAVDGALGMPSLTMIG